MKRLFTSESVTEGHPDKLCDQISDAILDAIFEKDPYGRVAAETTTTTGYAMVMGEISTKCYVDIPKLVRQVILDIGYDRSRIRFRRQHLRGICPQSMNSPATSQWALTNLLSIKTEAFTDNDNNRHNRCRRPGNHVRICLQRNTGTYAGTDFIRTQACKETY